MFGVTKPLHWLLNRPRQGRPRPARIHRDPFFADPAAVEDDYSRLSRIRSTR
jgi:hypothetical protein